MNVTIQEAVNAICKRCDTLTEAVNAHTEQLRINNAKHLDQAIRLNALERDINYLMRPSK